MVAIVLLAIFFPTILPFDTLVISNKRRYSQSLSKVLDVLAPLLLLQRPHQALQIPLVDHVELIKALAQTCPLVIVDVGDVGDGDAAFLADVDSLDEHVLHGALVGLALADIGHC